MTDDADYEMQPETLMLLKVFRDAGELMQSGGDPEKLLDMSAAVLHRMTDEEKGVTIIDLLTLFSEFERQVTVWRSEQMLKGDG